MLPPHATDRLPSWARALDAIAIALLLLGSSVLLTGGFREWTPFGSLSVRTWPRPVALGAMTLFVRHWLWRRPSIASRTLTAVNRWRRSEELRLLGPVLFSTRLGILVIGFLGIVLLGYAPNTPPYRLYSNDFLNMPARWDTGWYVGIATEGYRFDPSVAETMQNIAFFPAYPMLMRYLSVFAARQVLWVGVAISLGTFAWASVYLFRLARRYLEEDAAAASIAFLTAYPFAFFYSAAYTESLFLLTAVAACYHFEREELWKAGAWGLMAGLTRPNGCLLSVVLALMAIRGYRTASWDILAKRLTAAAAPGVGLIVFSAFVYFLTGNPLQWAQQHAAWGRVYRGLGALVFDRVHYVQINGLYDYVSTLGLDMVNAVATIFVLASVWPVFRRFGAPYAAMILLNTLVPLTMGGMLSMGRLTSTIFPTFLWLGAAVPVRHRTSWLLVFAMLQAVFAIAFFTWRPLY